MNMKECKDSGVEIAGEGECRCAFFPFLDGKVQNPIPDDVPTSFLGLRFGHRFRWPFVQNRDGCLDQKGGQTEKVGDCGKDVKGVICKIVMDGLVSMLEDTVEFLNFLL